MGEVEDFGEISTDHIERSFDALLETITGAEGISLTNNQIYIRSVLEINRMIQKSVSGNEGFFGAIADTAKAMYDYIVKMFKSIIRFFTGGDGESSSSKKIDDTKKAVEDTAKILKLTPFKSPNDQPTKDLKEAINKVVKDVETPPSVKEEAVKLVEQLEATPPPQPSAVKVISRKFADINVKKQKQVKQKLELIKNKATAMIDHITKLHAEKEKYKDGGESYTAYAGIVDALYGDVNSHVKPAINKITYELAATDVEGGPRIVVILGEQIKHVEGLDRLIKAYRGTLEQRIKRCEKVLGFKGDHTELKSEANKELNIAKDLVVLLNGVTNYISGCCDSITSTTKTVKQVFGIK